MKKQLKITLLPNGEIKMETKGVKGKKCLKYAELLEKLADAKIEKQEFTSEYYEQEVEEIQQQQNLYE
ncbi:MAG: DUF2997 domain-containing protein [bacterium]|nr:DUF2997 domain-containing protein [bacterium]